MGGVKNMQIEEDARAQAEEDAENACPTCGDVMEAVGADPQANWMMCARCEDKRREAEMDELMDEAESYIPDEFDS
jgi:tRNA(Ile2) C34 agmatinyltransferase TiaS